MKSIKTILYSVQLVGVLSLITALLFNSYGLFLFGLILTVVSFVIGSIYGDKLMSYHNNRLRMKAEAERQRKELIQKCKDEEDYEIARQLTIKVFGEEAASDPDIVRTYLAALEAHSKIWMKYNRK